MLKNNILSMWSIAKYNYKKLFANPRLYILLILQFIYLWYLVSPIVSLSKNVGIRVSPWIFPHITSYTIAQMFLMLGVIVLFADSPFIDEEYNYLIIRSGKQKWALVQIFYMITATALYFLVIFLLTVILTLPNIFLTANWGKIITTIANTDAGAHLELIINSKVLLTYSPIQATLLSFILSWLAGSIIAVIIFCVNLNSKKSIGIIVGTFIVFSDRAIFSNFPNFKLAYVSPVSLTSLTKISISNYGMSPTVMYALIFEFFFLVVVSFIAIIIVRKKSSLVN